MADSFVSRFGCYTIIWDTTARSWPSRAVIRPIRSSLPWPRMTPTSTQAAHLRHPPDGDGETAAIAAIAFAASDWSAVTTTNRLSAWTNTNSFGPPSP